MSHEFVMVVSVILEVAGLFLIAREVWRGHEMEKLAKDHEWAKQMNYLYAAKDYDGVYLLNRLDQGDTPTQACNWLTAINNPVVVQQTVDAWWGTQADKLSAALKNWSDKAEPAAFRKRQRDLLVGTLLLMAAALLHLASPADGQTQPPPEPEQPTGWAALASSPSFAIGATTFEAEVTGCPAAAETVVLVQKWLDNVLSTWKRRSRPSSQDSVILIGAADRLPLSHTLRRQYDSNMGLARGRAETVKRLLIEHTANETAYNRLIADRILVQVTGPGHTPKAGEYVATKTRSCLDPELARDRRVEIWIPVRETPLSPGRTNTTP